LSEYNSTEAHQLTKAIITGFQLKLTIEQALQRAITAHNKGDMQEAERFYRAILRENPNHPEASHNLGIIAISVNEVEAALPLFKTALKVNPMIEQFWESYIIALVKSNQLRSAKQAIKKAKKAGLDTKNLQILLPSQPQRAADAKVPSQAQINTLFEHYKTGRLNDAATLALFFTNKYPNYQFGWKILGAVLGGIGRNSEAVDANQKAIALSPQDFEAHYNLGVTLEKLGKWEDAEASYRRTIALKSDHADAHNNLGNALQSLGRLEEAAAIYRQTIVLKPDYADAHNNLGVTLKSLGKLDESEICLRKAIALKPDFATAYNNFGVTLGELGRFEEAIRAHNEALALEPGLVEAFWNLHSLEITLAGAAHFIDKCLIADANYEKARLTKAALSFYLGDTEDFYKLIKSKFKQHAYMRSFSWVFSLPTLPDLYFNKFHFFDAIIKKSIISKPFYEFGVWRGSSFKYLAKVFKKGYGFDTFIGLPEDWNVGNHVEKRGSYSSDGSIPKIKGGEFIVGKFEDTLPVFFSKSRPMASVINFDADLYSSTICALNFSKSVMDKDTILVFDEFIMHESWEKDEFKALNEFCSINNYRYEVIAISFFTKQVAVKLIGVGL